MQDHPTGPDGHENEGGDVHVCVSCLGRVGCEFCPGARVSDRPEARLHVEKLAAQIREALYAVVREPGNTTFAPVPGTPVGDAHLALDSLVAYTTQLETAVRRYHEWLEEVEKVRLIGGSYMGLDHALGENAEGCSGCAAMAARREGDTKE